MRQTFRAVNSLRGAFGMKAMRNVGVLLLGKGTQGVFSLIYQVLAARTLGPADFGTLMLIHRFTLGIAQLVNFQSWQAVVQYGSHALEAGDTRRFERLLGFARRVDTIGAVLALLIIVLAMPAASWLFDLPEHIRPEAQIYGLAVVPIVFASTSLGILRLFQRFDLLAAQVAVMPIVRLVGTGILWWMDAGLTAFLWLWLVSTAAGRIAQTVWASRELKKRGYASGFSGIARVKDMPEPGLWKFAIGTNASSSLDFAGSQLGILAVGWALGPEGAGIYSVAQQLSDVLIKPNTKLLVPAIYPELARLTAKGERAERKRVVAGMAWIAGLLSLTLFLILAFFGEDIIDHFFGLDYRDAYEPTLWMAVAGLIGAVTFPLEPLLIAGRRIRTTVIARGVGVGVYLGALLLLLPAYGLVGAAMATLVYAALTGLWFALASRSQLTDAKA